MPRKPTRDELDAELEHIMGINETENDMEATHLPNAANLHDCAPDLLEAAKSALHELKNLTTEQFQNGADKAIRENLAKVISKAEGRE